MDLRTSMPEFHDFAEALWIATAEERAQLLLHIGAPRTTATNRTLTVALLDLITAVCQENDLEIG